MVGFDFSVGILEPLNSCRQSSVEESHLQTECLAAQVEQAVWHATAAAVKDLHVELGENEVILLGRCQTYYIKQIAQHAAMATLEGWNVVNKIDVT